MEKGLMPNVIRICAIVSLVSCSAICAETGEFSSVDANRIPEILTVVADGVRSNYDEIKTWQGKVEVSADYIYKGARAEKVFKENTNRNGEIPKTVKKHKQTIIEFSLDAEKELLNANYYPDSVRPLQYMDLESGRDLGAKGVAVIRRAILTPEHELHCTGDRMRDGVVISRKAVKEARRKGCNSCSSKLPPVYDPRASFSPFGNHIPDLFPRLAELIKENGRYGIDEYDLEVEERKSGDISEYRIILPAKRSLDSQDYIFSTLVFRSDKDFNITSYQRTVRNAVHNGILLQKRTWSYDLVDGVHVPSKMTQQDFDWPDGGLRHEKTKTFKNQKVNKPIPEGTFSYKNIGLKEGDKFIDKILDREFIYQEGELIPATSGSSYMPKQTIWPTANLNGDCCMNWEDSIILASHWLDS